MQNLLDEMQLRNQRDSIQVCIGYKSWCYVCDWTYDTTINSSFQFELEQVSGLKHVVENVIPKELLLTMFGYFCEQIRKKKYLMTLAGSINQPYQRYFHFSNDLVTVWR